MVSDGMLKAVAYGTLIMLFVLIVISSPEYSTQEPEFKIFQEICEEVSPIEVSSFVLSPFGNEIPPPDLEIISIDNIIFENPDWRTEEIIKLIKNSSNFNDLKNKIEINCVENKVELITKGNSRLMGTDTSMIVNNNPCTVYLDFMYVPLNRESCHEEEVDEIYLEDIIYRTETLYLIANIECLGLGYGNNNGGWICNQDNPTKVNKNCQLVCGIREARDKLIRNLSAVDLRISRDIINISKQDLTTEWLDENARCVESTCQGDSFEYKERCYEDIDYGKCLEKIENKEFGNKNSLMCASGGGKITLKSCSKYKLENELQDYTIEVLR